MTRTFPVMCQCPACKEQLDPAVEVPSYTFEIARNVKLSARQTTSLPILAQISELSDDVIPRISMRIESSPQVEELLNRLLDTGVLCSHCYLINAPKESRASPKCCNICSCKYTDDYTVEDIEEVKNKVGRCDCAFCKKERRKKLLKQGAAVVGGTVAALVAFHVTLFAAPAILGIFGAGAATVTFAAALQAWIGGLTAAGLFAQFMTMGAKEALSPAAIWTINSLFGLANSGGITAKYFTDEKGKLKFPETDEEFKNLIDALIADSLLCGFCGRLINPPLKGNCRSVCWHDIRISKAKVAVNK